MGILCNTSPRILSERKHSFRFQITLDEHMTSSGGALIQENVVGAITPVTITAEPGFTLIPPIVAPWGMSAVISNSTTCIIKGTPRADTVINCASASLLLPYSDQSKLVTYATADNFNPDSSTWGVGAAPVVRSAGLWFKNDDDSVSFSSTANSAINNVDVLGSAFTIYEVLYLNNALSDINSRNIQIYRGEQSTGYVNDDLFRPLHSTASRRYYYRSRVSTNEVLTVPNLVSLEQYHITVGALEYLPNSQLVNTYLRCNDAVDPTSVTYNPGQNPHIQCVKLAGSPSSTQRRLYKFIAVVAEKESDTVISNNITFLKNYFSVVY